MLLRRGLWEWVVRRMLHKQDLRCDRIEGSKSLQRGGTLFKLATNHLSDEWM